MSLSPASRRSAPAARRGRLRRGGPARWRRCSARRRETTGRTAGWSRRGCAAARGSRSPLARRRPRTPLDPRCWRRTGPGIRPYAHGSARAVLYSPKNMTADPPPIEGVRRSFVDARGVRFHVTEAGPPDGRPVLALHGWPQHHWEYRDLLADPPQGLRIIAPDLPGYGWSGPPPHKWAKDDVADDVLALMDAHGSGSRAAGRPRLGRFRRLSDDPWRPRAVRRLSRDEHGSPVGVAAHVGAGSVAAVVPGAARHRRGAAATAH